MALALTNCLGVVAPYYNLVLVTILVICFIYLLRLPNKRNVYVEPWTYLFYALLIFIVEEMITILNALNIVNISRVLFPFFEMAMICLFIYMCLLEREYLKNE